MKDKDKYQCKVCFKLYYKKDGAKLHMLGKHFNYVFIRLRDLDGVVQK